MIFGGVNVMKIMHGSEYSAWYRRECMIQKRVNCSEMSIERHNP